MRKLKFIMLFCLFSSMLFAAQKSTKTIKNEYDLKLGMNCKYIKEFIDNVDKNLIIEATNSSSMLRFMEEGNENYIYLIMPVNIRV